MLRTLTPSQAIETIVEHARANLVLQDKRESGTKSVITFKGRGVSGIDLDVPFALEVVIQIDRALSFTHFDKVIGERSSPKHGSEITYTGILFPKSIDYATAALELNTPYFKQANLLPDWIRPELRERYARFVHYDVKDLSRIEWAFAIPLSGYKIAYFNPLNGSVQVHQFLRFNWNEIIPDNRPNGERVPEEGYLWDFVERGAFPVASDPPGKSSVFTGIQRGLHDRIRRIVKTEEINGRFTLSRYAKEVVHGARVVEYKQK